MKLFAKIALMAIAIAFVSSASAQLNIYETLGTQSDMTTLLSLIDSQPAVKARLESTSADTTLFAPTNDAITAALAAGFDASNSDLVLNTLLYHAVDGTVMSSDLSAEQAVPTLVTDNDYVQLDGDAQRLVITVSGSTVSVSYGLGAGQVVAANIEATNGVIHKVNALLLLPQNVVATATAAGLNSLLAAVTRANLGNTLLEAESITVFAPTDAAFAALGDINDIPVDTLRDVLLYHVVDSAIYSSELSSSQKVETLQGDYMTVRKSSSGAVTVDGSADVVIANALISNGNVHVINEVLAPSGDDGSDAGHLQVTFAIFLVALIFAFF